MPWSWSFFNIRRREVAPESDENHIEVVPDTNFIEIPQPPAIHRASAAPDPPDNSSVVPPGTVYVLSEPEYVGRIRTQPRNITQSTWDTAFETVGTAVINPRSLQRLGEVVGTGVINPRGLAPLSKEQLLARARAKEIWTALLRSASPNPVKIEFPSVESYLHTPRKPCPHRNLGPTYHNVCNSTMVGGSTKRIRWLVSLRRSGPHQLIGVTPAVSMVRDRARNVARVHDETRFTPRSTEPAVSERSS